MKKFCLAGLLVTLGISALLGWRFWPADRSLASVPTAKGPADTTAATHGRVPPFIGVPRNLASATVNTTAMSATASRQPQKRAWDYNYFAGLTNTAPGTPIQFELAGGHFAAGMIQHTERIHGELTGMSGVLTAPEPGRFFFQKQSLAGKQGDFAGGVEFPASKTAWRIEPSGPDGNSELVERRLDEVICLAMPPIDPALADTNTPEEMPPLRPDQVTDYIPTYNNGIISLQSLPGATGVLYIDYRGGYTPTWGGIAYDKPVVTSAQIKDVWKRVAEDYLPFTINVTTDIRVYLAAPENSRQRCICTPTTTAAPGAGGVSYIGSWNWTGDTPNWSFYSTGKAAAEVIAHECGHCVGLSHETTDINGVHTEYFTGQGSGATGWCPIMGAGYYQNVTTWAKGEYQYAGNLEDQLNTITTANNNVAYRTDDTGATLATARYLEVYSNNAAFAEGVIERTGDTDAFRFTTAGGTISLTASPVATNDWANLAIMATLADATDTIIASNNPQNVLTASIATNLPAGTYTFRVTGAGRNNPLTNGFSNYASLGYYSITGAVAAATQTTRFTIAENSTNGLILGTISATNLGVDALNYFIVSGDTSNTFALDNNGVLTVNNGATLDYEALARNTQLAVQFEMFVNITNMVNPSLTELNRRVVVQVTNMNEAPFVSGFTNTLVAHTQPGTVVGTVQTSDPDAYTALTLSILAGNSNAMFTLDNATGNLLVAGDPNSAVQSVYNLTIQVADNGSPALTATNYIQVSIITNNSPFRPGTISYAIYDNIGSGVFVSNLTTNSRFPTDPTSERQVTTAAGDTNRADSYGSVLRGYVIPPVSGIYYFYIATDDNGELWMSTTTNPASMTLIANINGSSAYVDSPGQWNKYASQKSAARSLVAGQAYYLEARQKEGGGGDSLVVGWSGLATGNQTNVISGLYLAPSVMNYIPHLTGFTNTVHRDAITGARVGQMTVTDVNTNDSHAFAIIAGNTAGIFGADSNGWIYVASDTALASSATTNFTLTVRTTDSGSPALSGTNTVVLTRIEPGVIASTQLQREMFNNIGSGTLVSDLTNNVRFPGAPDSLVALTNFAAPANVADNYGSRIRALLVPSVTGDYQFFIASDDSSSLKFSRDTNAANAAAIASVSGYTSQSVWNTYASQTSAVITNLIAGNRYYIEALQKEGGGGDHVSVAWLVPGSGATNIIPGANLLPVDLNYPPQFGAQSFGVTPGAAIGSPVGTVIAADSALDTLTFKIISGNTNSTFSLDPSSGLLAVSNNVLLVGGPGTSFNLTVAVQDSGYGGLYPLHASTNSVFVTVASTNVLVWDVGTNLAGPQDGNGNWGATATNWWNGSTNSVWTNNLVAVFGAGAATNCTVTITNDVTPAGMVFNPNNGGTYTIASSGVGLNFSGLPVITANGDANISAVIKGSGYLKNGPGTLLVSGSNVSIGGATVNAGTLKLTNTVATFGSGPVTNNATIEWNTATASRTIGGINSFAGAGLFLKSGANNLQLQGGNVSTFSGTVRVAGGQLILDSAAGFAAGAPNLDLTGGDLVLGNAFDNGTATFGNLSGSGQVRVDWGNTSVTRTISLNQTSNTVYAGVLGYRAAQSRTMNLIKNGAGTLTLAGTNVFTGTTTISNGTLLVSGVLTTNATSTVTVAASATLGGTGLVNGTTTVQGGGTLAPGNSGIGQLTISNNATLAGSSVTVMELSKNGGVLTNDQLFVSGILTQGGTLVVTNIGTNALAVGDSFQLFNAATNAGAFASFVLPALPVGWHWSTNSLATNGILAVVWDTFTLTYAAGTNGTLAGSATQVVNYAASGTTVTAIPNSGYAFTNWSDGLTANPRMDASVTDNLNVTANFVMLAPPVITNLNLAAGQAAFSLSGTGAANQVYVLLSATNLPPLFWTPVATNPADANGVFQFTNLQTTNCTQQFYRVMAE